MENNVHSELTFNVFKITKVFNLVLYVFAIKIMFFVPNDMLYTSVTLERGAGRRKLVLSDSDDENTTKDKG